MLHFPSVFLTFSSNENESEIAALFSLQTIMTTGERGEGGGREIGKGEKGEVKKEVEEEKEGHEEIDSQKNERKEVGK